jgi:GDP-4-dehydro-6-deoxy-D-mannose reductase
MTFHVLLKICWITGEKGYKLRVFVTGASGFVGRFLLKALRNHGCTCFGTTYPDHPESVKPLCEDGVCRLDIRSQKDMLSALEESRPQWVFHLAAVSNVGYSWKHRRETLETNILGTFQLLEGIKKTVPGARVLFVSSSDVYGVSGELRRALQEEDPIDPVNPYAYSKISGEQLCRFYSHIEGLDIVISRSFPHTGPGQSTDFVCSDWAHQIAAVERGKLEPVIHVGNIEVKRDFSDVRDTVGAYISLLEKGRSGEIYNVSRGYSLALKDILQILVDSSYLRIKIEVDPSKFRKVDIPDLWGSHQKIKEHTGWEAGIPLSKTLTDLLYYWRNNG